MNLRVKLVRLRDLAVFRGVRMVAGSIEWPGGMDLSYDTLYLGGVPLDSSVPIRASDQTLDGTPRVRL